MAVKDVVTFGFTRGVHFIPTLGFGGFGIRRDVPLRTVAQVEPTFLAEPDCQPRYLLEAEAMLYVGNDNNLRIKGLADEDTGELIDDAAIVATVYDSDGDPVSGAEDIPIEWTGVSGRYVGVLDADVDLTAGAKYRIVFASSNYDFQVSRTEQAKIRRCSQGR